MDILTDHLGAIIAILGLITSQLYTYYGQVTKLKEAIGELEKNQGIINTKVDLFWNCVEDKMTELLKSFPTNIPKDVLLDKMKDKTLNIDDAELLRTMLNCEMQKSDKEKLAYILVLARLEQLIKDMKNDTDNQ